MGERRTQTEQKGNFVNVKSVNIIFEKGAIMVSEDRAKAGKSRLLPGIDPTDVLHAATTITVARIEHDDGTFRPPGEIFEDVFDSVVKCCLEMNDRESK